MKRSTLPWSGRRLATKGLAAALATATAATVAGMAATPAHSVGDAECPDAFPVDQLFRGQQVTGSTVTEGTVPKPFTGRVIGVLENGIMPGLDMIMVDLGAAAGIGADDMIHDVGIWSGMSGSPVYADGKLIGAVAYGLAGNSTVAGLTPAADMRELLDGGAAPSAPAETVEVSERLEDRVVESGAATRTQVEGGLRQLNVMALSGLTQQRFNKVTRKLGLDGVQRMVGTAGSAAGLTRDDIVSGGNVAAAISYGDISYTGVGTATMVCGDDVVGFGHPMMWSGPTQLSLHPADAVYVQKDVLWNGFKVANIGVPVGTIDQDRMAGIAGAFGARPASTEITSNAVSGTEERTGTSWVNVTEWMPDVALSHLLTNEDRVFDGMGKGSGTMSYTILGRAEDGTPFAVTRKDVYVSGRDLTWETAWDFYTSVSRLAHSRAEKLTIDSIETDSSLSREVVRASIDEVSIKQGRRWVPLSQLNRLALPAGQAAQLRVDLLNTATGPSSIKVEVPIRKKDAGRRGHLQVVGGNSVGDWWGGRRLPLDELIKRIEGAPHNDDIIAGVHLYRSGPMDRNVQREERISAGVPVNGGQGVRLRITGGNVFMP